MGFVMGDDDIFDDDDTVPKETKNEVDPDNDLEKQPPPEKPLFLTKKRNYAKKIGAGIFGVIGLIMILSFTGIIDITDSESFDSSQCNFGVQSDFLGQRCITEEEFIKINEFEEANEQIPVQEKQPQTSGGGTKDTSSATDKVIVEKTNDVIGYYLVTSEGDWYGDFVDIRKIPSKIEKSGNVKVNFRCYTDEFAGTSSYFATFRNVIENALTVEVYINGLEVESKTTNSNKALILEGSCYGHNS